MCLPTVYVFGMKTKQKKQCFRAQSLSHQVDKKRRLQEIVISGMWMSDFRWRTFFFICRLFCRGGDTLPVVGLWRQQVAQTWGSTGGGSQRGERCKYQDAHGFCLFVFFVKELMRDQNTDVANFLMKVLSHPGQSKCCNVGIDVFQFLEDVSLPIQEASSGLTNWRRVAGF